MRGEPLPASPKGRRNIYSILTIIKKKNFTHLFLMRQPKKDQAGPLIGGTTLHITKISFTIYSPPSQAI